MSLRPLEFSFPCWGLLGAHGSVVRSPVSMGCFNCDLIERLCRIEAKLDRILEKDYEMADSITDVNDAIAAEAAELGTLGSALSKLEADAAKLLAALQSGQPPADFTPQVQALAANLAVLSGAVARVSADDTAVEGALPVSGSGGTGQISVSPNQPPLSAPQ